MSTCRKCGVATDDISTLICIRTMTVRDIKGSKRYQAMGDVIDLPLCSGCVGEYIESRKSGKAFYRKAILVPALLAVMAAAIFILKPDMTGTIGGTVFAGFAALVLGSELKKIKAETAQIRAASDADNRRLLTASLAAQLLPKKHNDADLTYIELDRIMHDDLSALSTQYRVSSSKLNDIRAYINKHKGEDSHKASIE